MKKVLLSLLSLATVFTLASCNTTNPSSQESSQTTTSSSASTSSSSSVVAEDKTMSYSEFMAAEQGDEVRIQGYVAAKQSWWNNSAVVYLVGAKGEGYLIYGFPMTQEEFNTVYTVGTCINVKGTKTIYAEEHEIDGSKGVEATVVTDAPAYNKEAMDITASVKSEDIFKYQNSYFSATLTVKEYTTTDTNTTVSANKAYGMKGDTPTDDLYLLLEDANGNVLSSCVEAYLTGVGTDVYNYVLNNLAVDQKVKVEGYLYWWNGANPHITSIALAA